jgi:ABC-type phosphate/phosphonate transport system ATPase subunit
MTSTYINLGSQNISFQSGNTYRFGSNVTVSVVNTVFLSVVHPAAVTEKINAGDFVLVSGSFGLGASSTFPIQTNIETTSVGTTLQIEQAAAEAARRDTQLAAKVNVHTQQIADLETAAAGKAVIDDTSTAIDKVLSASKTLALISTAKTELEAFANSAASGIIDDTSTGTDKVLSASKITALLAALDNAAKNYASAAKSDLLNGADSAYDTLKEIQTFLQENAGVLDALEQAGLNKVSFTELQSLSPEQKQTARTNIGAITAAEATTITNDRIAAVVGDPATVSTAAIFASMTFTLV